MSGIFVIDFMFVFFCFSVVEKLCGGGGITRRRRRMK